MWKQIFKYQCGTCAICNKKFESKGDCKLDHRHSDGRINGILCFRCNAVLREYIDVPFLESALEYLTNPPATYALGGVDHFGLPGKVGTKRQRKLAAKLKKESKK